MNMVLEAWLHFGGDEPLPDLARAVLTALPEADRPSHFSSTEMPRWTDDHCITNTTRFEQFMRTQVCYWFFTRWYELVIGLPARRGRVALLVAKHRPLAEEMVHTWFLRLDGVVEYASAGSRQEYEHRNGYCIKVAGLSHFARGWLGRDTRRYIPGLYWLNYMSDSYIQLHRISMSVFDDLSNVERKTLQHGTLTRLYQHPDQWIDNSSVVDNFLLAHACFFSKKRMELPETVKPRELMGVVAQLGRTWP